MNQAALYLIGSHDFSSFQTQPTENEDPICHLQRLVVIREGHELRIEAYADRFLKQMVRSLVGTLVEVGRQARPTSFPAILAAHAGAQPKQHPRALSSGRLLMVKPLLQTTLSILV